MDHSNQSTHKNFFCLLCEGALNQLGGNILGISTIMPLFLQAYGASMKMIGFVSAVTSSIVVLTPFIVGNLVAGFKSKRKFIIIVNSIGRSSILLMLPVLFFVSPSDKVLWYYFAIISIFFAGQSSTSLAWNDLMSRAVIPAKRGLLMGNLQIASGVATLLSSFLLKFVLDSSLQQNYKYAVIFGLAGFILCFSVIAMLPLCEPVAGNNQSAVNLRGYIKNLIVCLQNKAFARMVMLQSVSSISTAGYRFLFIFANKDLGLEPYHISNMIVFQTVGTMVGGLLFGRIITYYGSKNVIRISEAIAVAIPIFSILSMHVHVPFIIMYGVALLLGLKTGSTLGYTNYLIDVVKGDMLVYSIVTKGLLLFPVTYFSLLAGALVDQAGMKPLFIIQIFVSMIAVILAYTQIGKSESAEKQTEAI